MALLGFSVANITYSIPEILIREGTFLHTYLRFQGVKNRDMDGNYILDPEDHHHFQEFYNFLLGGDFTWNEDIAAYFGFMGYPNTLEYPLSFWKVKLQDNWIRDNFYKLELWKEDSNLYSDLIQIQRGPYVGLVEIPHEEDPRVINFSNTAFDLEMVKNVDFASGNIILAGGSLTLLLSKDPRMPHDLDFFLMTKDPLVAKEEIKKLLVNYPCMSSVCENTEIILTQNAITIGSYRPYTQIIFRLYQCPSETVHGFDIDASGVLYDGKAIWATRRAYYAHVHKINYFDYDRMSPTYGYRLAKYATRGYQVWLPDFDKKNKLTRKLAEIVYQCKRDYRTKTEEDCSLYLERGVIPRQEAMAALKNNSSVRELCKKANPVDLILFATYFRYLPTLPFSDYDSLPDKKPVIREKNIILRPPGGEPEPYWFNEEDSHEWSTYYYLGKGYLKIKGIFPSEFFKELQGQIEEDIFDLSKEFQEITGLPGKIQWKTQDPMSQVTSTFHPTQLKSIQEWYDSAEYCKEKEFSPISESCEKFGYPEDLLE
jgi:hypothetical protein